MTNIAFCFLLSAAAFSGALVSGLAGFAFSAVAGAILLHALPPMEAVPLMMACSVGVQAANLWALRKNIQWRGSLFLIIGGCSVFPLRSVSFSVLTPSHSGSDLERSWQYMRRMRCSGRP
jgi:uncharacterized membrane protein YfcA